MPSDLRPHSESEAHANTGAGVEAVVEVAIARGLTFVFGQRVAPMDAVKRSQYADVRNLTCSQPRDSRFATLAGDLLRFSRHIRNGLRAEGASHVAHKKGLSGFPWWSYVFDSLAGVYGASWSIGRGLREAG